MSVKNYNGEGRWSVTEILDRYARFASELRVNPRDLSPREHADKNGERWIYPVIDKVIEGIESGDSACIVLGIEFIEEDAKFPFGKILKANTARALRRASLTDKQKERIRRRVFAMLRAGQIPREYREYARLLRKIGFDARELASIAKSLDYDNPYVVRFYNYFEEASHPGD